MATGGRGSVLHSGAAKKQTEDEAMTAKLFEDVRGGCGSRSSTPTHSDKEPGEA